ncbi:MAG: S16 family serine protease [Candidatus Aenigmatarchaeota archaeon]
MPKRKKSDDLQMALVIIVVFLAGVLVAMQFIEPKEIIKQPINVVRNLNAPQVGGGTHVEMVVPAVDKDGKGVATTLVVDAQPGSGKILTNIDILLFWVDTQQSIQIARDVAENVTGMDAGSLDITYAMDVDNVTLIGGPSAGAALTLATIAALKGQAPNSDAAITGTINPDGSIGRVGSVLEKAGAVKRAGVKTFLVPKGESTEKVVRPLEKCVEGVGFTYCETVFKEEKVNIGEALGIDVVEVSSIAEALPYFFSQA